MNHSTDNDKRIVAPSAQQSAVPKVSQYYDCCLSKYEWLIAPNSATLKDGRAVAVPV